MITFKQTAKSLVPFTQVPFSGEMFPLAVGRIILYGALAYGMRNHKYLMYGALAAAGVSAIASLSPVVVTPAAPIAQAVKPPLSDLKTVDFSTMTAQRN